jgi:hypothetical protein
MASHVSPPCTAPLLLIFHFHHTRPDQTSSPALPPEAKTPIKPPSRPPLLSALPIPTGPPTVSCPRRDPPDPLLLGFRVVPIPPSSGGRGQCFGLRRSLQSRGTQAVVSTCALCSIQLPLLRRELRPRSFWFFLVLRSGAISFRFIFFPFLLLIFLIYGFRWALRRCQPNTSLFVLSIRGINQSPGNRKDCIFVSPLVWFAIDGPISDFFSRVSGAVRVSDVIRIGGSGVE